MKSATICLTVIGLLLISSVAVALEPLALYDNFQGKTLDPVKWFGGQSTDSGMVTLETSRLMKNETVLKSKALSLSNRSYASTGSDSDHSTAATRIFFSNGSNIKTIEATVLVKKIQVPECNTNTYATDVRARIGGAFFNTGTPTSGNSTNDVWGQITVGRTLDSEDPADTLRVYAKVYRCTDDSCSTTTWVGSEDPQDLGTVKLNKKVKLRITWDPDRNEFIFQKGKSEEFVVHYGVSDTSGPGGLNGGMKRLEIQEFLPNCMSDPRPVGYIEASFDNVMINELPPP